MNDFVVGFLFGVFTGASLGTIIVVVTYGYLLATG